MHEINRLANPAELADMSRRERKKQETRWRLYDAAMELFVEHGYDEVKIDSICEAADVSNALFFHHFSNKSALILAYIDRLKVQIREQLEQKPEASSTEKLKTISHEVSLSSRESAAFSPQLLAALGAGEQTLDMEHLDTGVTGILSQIIRDGQIAGEFNSAWHPELVAVNLLSAWIVMPMAMKSSEFPARPYDELLELVLCGIMAER